MDRVFLSLRTKELSSLVPSSEFLLCSPKEGTKKGCPVLRRWLHLRFLLRELLPKFTRGLSVSGSVSAFLS